MLLLASSCSTTSHLPENEELYTGIKKMTINSDSKGKFYDDAITEVKAALAYAPNSSFMGSSYYRFPMPIGLWVYNSLVDKDRNGFENWLYKSFGRTPVTITSVNPDTRVLVASNTLQNYGYFNGKVDYDIISQKNPKKKKISYTITTGQPYYLDSIAYIFEGKEDSIVRSKWDERMFKSGDQFNVTKLEGERERIVNSFRNNGYYYYRPEYVIYAADSSMVPQKVQLVVAADRDMPSRAHRQYHIGNLNINLRPSGMMPTESMDTFKMRSLTVSYTGDKMPITPMALLRNFRMRRGEYYNHDKYKTTVTNLSNMGIFSSIQFDFMPRDTSATCDTLDMVLNAMLDKPIDSEFGFNFTQKSNSQVGPNATLKISKKNAFRHGETFSVGLKGAYEWQTDHKKRQDGTQIDSYEWGVETSVSYPRIMFPWLNRRVLRYPATTTFSFSIDQLRRSGYYNLLSSTAEASYVIKGSKYITHTIKPLTLTYNKLINSSATFDSIAAVNTALFVTVRNQFIPAMQYTYTFDNTMSASRRNTTRFEASIKESGNLVSLLQSTIGKDFNEHDKTLFKSPYSQFLKLTLDLRHYIRLTKYSQLAMRLLTGAVWSYGNSTVAPYTEQFYVGGANDIRAFGVRSIGPGHYYDYANTGTYLDQSGDFKLEFNTEYRFRMVSNLYGALFLDAGNVWLMKSDDFHTGGSLSETNFLKDIALGTGFGFRYDLEYLILRLDIGVGIHAPYDTGKSGYYNIPKFWKGLGLHFAVGYPF